jgi:hypothetical protein
MKKIMNVIKVITIKMVFIFSFTIYNPENIIPPIRLLLVVVKTEIGVACNHAKSLGSVRAFNRVGFIIVPIYGLKAEVDVGCIIGNLGVREMAHRAIIRGRWIIIFYKHAFAIQVGKFRTFFSDEVHFSGDKVGWGDKSEWSHCGRG